MEIVLYCNRFIILFTQIALKKQTQKIKKTLLILQYSTLKSTVVQYNSWHTGAGIEWTGKKSYWLEEGEEMGDGRAEGSSAIGDRGQAAVSLTPDVDGTGSGSLLYHNSVKLASPLTYILTFHFDSGCQPLSLNAFWWEKKTMLEE